jgi:asparagine synthase (glutamine-hydrolysing)
MNPFLAYFDLHASGNSREWFGEVESKLRALPHDRFECLDRPDVWIAQASLDTGAVAIDRATPRVLSDGRYVVVFSGWIENRDEIDRLLGDAQQGATAFDDADRALAGWLRWEHLLANKLYGEYSIIIYDFFKKTVISIRDKIGVQPLFYWAKNEIVILSNLPGFITLAPFVGAVINNGYLAEFLHANLRSHSETLFKNVTRVPGGHWLHFSLSDGAQVRRYWHPDAAIIDRPISEILDEFKRIFFGVVENAAKTSRPLTVEISGGIDSSSVAVTLSELTKRGVFAAEEIRGISKVFPGLACDETAYSDAVAKEIAFDCLQLSSALPDLDLLEQWTASLNYPVYPFALFSSMNHYQQMRARGSRIAITGEGGDELCRPSERMRRRVYFSPFRVVTLAKALASLWRDRPREASFLGQIRHTVRPWLGTALDAWIERLRSKETSKSWLRIDREWADEVNLDRRVTSRGDSTNARNAVVAGALSGFYGHSHESMAGFASLFGVEPRHPLYSARLVEYANRMPVECFDDFAGITKWPLRQVMRHHLPESIRQRGDKAEFTVALLPTLRKIAEQQFASGVPMRDGDTQTRRTIEVDLSARHVWTLAAASSFEIWLRRQPSLASLYRFTPVRE